MLIAAPRIGCCSDGGTPAACARAHESFSCVFPSAGAPVSAFAAEMWGGPKTGSGLRAACGLPQP